MASGNNKPLTTSTTSTTTCTHHARDRSQTIDGFPLHFTSLLLNDSSLALLWASGPLDKGRKGKREQRLLSRTVLCDGKL